MGGGASVEQAHTLSIDYATLRSSGINFNSAYNELESRLHKLQIEKSDSDVDMSVNVLAIRQLSQNLRNQDNLERTRRKVLKSRSLPDNLRYKERGGSFQGFAEATHCHPIEVRDEFEQDDLDIIEDSEFSVLPNYSEEGKSDKHKQTKKLKPKKPMLSLQLTEHSDNAFSGGDNSIVSHGDHGKNNSINDSNMVMGSFTGTVSPRGTLYMGLYKINEKGIFPDDSAPNSPVKVAGGKQIFLCDTALMNGSFHLQRLDSNSPEGFQQPALGGKDDFIEVSTLGSGASGVVVEAIHVPSLTIVALKMLPVYNQEKRQHVSRELRVLYKNLSEMRLIDETLSEVFDSGKSIGVAGVRDEKCRNVLSLYNAFVDPKSGMINLVIEYMDGGSLEDLVKQGGCDDERVLADIAYQTLNGLSFLHRNKNIHRDIKPANILCSSSGLIKIADFGISKALDKSTGFANSFVGTVCYMSPERINGDNYSFSCDIWSLGLTLLAVAKGRFPISVNGDQDSSKPQVIGGPGGYWAMMKAICDDEPPVAGPRFSETFNSFISHCLKKDPNERFSAKALLDDSFVSSNRSPDYQHGDTENPYSTAENQSDYDAQILKLTGSIIEKSVSGGAANPLSESKQSSSISIIYSIRLEHLDRVLGKLVSHMQDKKVFARASSDQFMKDDSRSGGIITPEELLSPLPVRKMQNTKPFTNTLIEEKDENGQSHRLNNTNKSVHFESEDVILSAPPKGKKKPMLKLNILEINGDGDLEDDTSSAEIDDGRCNLGGLTLPKTSSYFTATNTEKNDVKLVTPTNYPITPYAASKIDYKKMVPRFDKHGLQKWKHLASQLNLPLPIVLIAVRSRLGNIIDLDEAI